MDDLKIGKLITLGGAGVAFIFSFLPWASVSALGYNASRSAWGSGLFPIATWVPLFALIVGFFVAADTFKFINVPAKLWEFTLDQVVLILSAFSLLITLSYLIVDKSGANIGFGLILCFVGTMAMLGGAVVDKLGINFDSTPGANGTGGPSAPQSGNFPPASPPPPGQNPPPPAFGGQSEGQAPPPPEQPGTF